MTDLTIRDVFDLPPAIPRCIVQIQDFDDPGVLRENIRDYVITETIAAQMERLVERVATSCVRHETGEGHYLHGSFGSGKSHFMAILGLILENHQAVWARDHPVIRRIHERHGAWLAEHPVLVVPVHMIDQHSLQMACYNAANARLKQRGLPPCEFSDADKVIASFRADAQRYGEVVFQQFEEATGISQKRFDKMAAAGQEQRDDLAQKILQYRDPGRAERAQLYPDKFSDGMAQLTRHVKAHGFAGVVYLVDELILYLTGKSGRQYVNEFNDLVALVDTSSWSRAVPLWVVVAKQRNIAETVPDDTSQHDIFTTMEHHKDRFPETTELADTELAPIVQERVLRLRRGMEKPLHQAMEETLGGLGDDVRATLLHDLAPEDFRRLYPFHPALIRSLIDVSARLSRERAAIRLLYELLIQHYADLPIGSLIPYAALFDVVFLPHGLTGGSSNEELDAVRQTYYERLEPLIQEMYEGEQAERARLVVKSVLLCGLSRTMREDVTVERILHLNYQDLHGRTPLGSYQAVARILADLANRSELVHFNPNPANPALGVAEITLASGVQLADVLKRIPPNWRQRLEAFNELMKDCLEKPVHNGEVPNYERVWRGTRRRGRVRFANVAELATNDMLVAAGDEMTLFVDYPFDLGEVYTRADDLKTIERARTVLPQVPVGFWLPAEFSPEDVRDLDEYARMRELESNSEQYLEEYGKTQREDVLSKLVGHKRTKAGTLRNRLSQAYKGVEAAVTFLDPAITPSLDVDSLGAALDRIADAVCDRLYPHHPRFPSELDRRTLGRLLGEFLVPAALGGGSVPRNLDLDGLLHRLGEPLELAEQGAQNWTLRVQSRYLGKLDELAAGRQVQADHVVRGLWEAFGFTRDLSETFVLYLIRGQGYRALRGGRPVANVDYGGLAGLVLERGKRLAVHEWALVKELVQATWQVRPEATELTVAAQDQLWRQMHVAASTARQALGEARRRLVELFNLAGVSPDEAARLSVLDAAQALNSQAVREDVDSCDGLQALLSWQPEGPGVTRDAATRQLAHRDQTRMTINDLQTDTLKRIVTLAEGGNAEAASALEQVQAFLAASEEQADLASHVLSWQERANAIIDQALVALPERKPEGTADVHETSGRTQVYVTTARLEIGDWKVTLGSEGIDLVKRLLEQSGVVLEGEPMEVSIHITFGTRE